MDRTQADQPKVEVCRRGLQRAYLDNPQERAGAEDDAGKAQPFPFPFPIDVEGDARRDRSSRGARVS